MQVERQQEFKSLTIYDMMNKEPGTKEFLESISRNSKGTAKEDTCQHLGAFPLR